MINLERSISNDDEGFLKLLANIQKHIVLEPAEIAFLTSMFSHRTVRKKELLQQQGERCRKLFFVASGSIRAFNVNDDGKESTIMFAMEDWWITDMYCFLNRQKAVLSLEVLEDSTVFELTYGAFQNSFEKLPKLERFFRILFQNAYVREQTRVLETISLTTEERYHNFKIKYPKIVEKVTQKQIASYLGVTPEFLSAIKKNKLTP